MSRLTRIEELLATRATERLTEEESHELQRLLSEQPGAESDDFEIAAAALDEALAGGDEEPLPAHLRDKISSQAAEHFGTSGTAGAEVVELASRRPVRSPCRGSQPPRQP